MLKYQHLGVKSTAMSLERVHDRSSPYRTPAAAFGACSSRSPDVERCNGSSHLLGAALAARGVHVLAIDYRGYGDSPAGDRDQLDGDIDVALAALSTRAGVDTTRLVAGGASCGVRNAVGLAQRSGRIAALLLLSGPTPDDGLAWLRAHPAMPIYAAASATEDFAVRSLQSVVATSTNPVTTMRVVRAPGHGAPMFAADSTLLSAVADWVARVLR
jgi:pimeloyl-ACP methyl ester carboxylesterase